jgi:hypothetical protein
VQYEMILTVKTVTENAQVTGKIKRISDSNWLTSSGTWDVSEQAFDTFTDSTSPVLAPGYYGITVYEASPSTSLYEFRNIAVTSAP